MRNLIKHILKEEVTKKYPKPTEKVDKLVYRWLDNYFEGSQIYKNESWKYYSFSFEFCNNGREIADLHVRFDDKSPDFGLKDKRPTSERSVDEVQLFIYPDMIYELLADIPIRKNYLLYLIEEWFEDAKLNEIQQGFNRNDFSLDKVTVFESKKRGDICAPPPTKPEGLTKQEMMDLIKLTTLYSYKDIEKHEEDEPGWIEDLYLAKLQGKERERLNQEDNEGTLREEVEELKKSSVKDSLQQMIDKIGVMPTAEFVGGINNLVKLRYGGDLKSFYEQNNFVPYKISDNGMDMYIDDLIVQLIGSPLHYTKKEKSLGEVSFGPKNGTQYKFSAKVDGPKMKKDNQLWWRVIGTSGDSGFGYGFVKNQLGKRYRGQIFQQIIDKYNLQEYM